MDSIALAIAIANYWAEKYSGAEGQDQPYTIGRIERGIKMGLSNQSAHPWCAKLGGNWTEVCKTIYKDGYKRLDVQQYQQNVYCSRKTALRVRMMEWDDDLQLIVKNLGALEKTLRFIRYDKSGSIQK